MNKNKTKKAREEKNGREHKKRHSRDRQATAPEPFSGNHKDLQGWVYMYDTAARAYQ